MSFLVASIFNFEAYNVMTFTAILIMFFGGLSSIDENALKFGSTSAPHLNTIMNSCETGVKKQHDLYFESSRNTDFGYFSNKLKLF